MKSSDEARGVLRSRALGDGGRKLLSTVVIKQAEQLAALASERFAALKSRRQKLLDVRNGLAQPRDGSGAQRLALLLDHRLNMSGIFDASVAVVGAAVARQFRGAIKQAHGISIGHKR